ncbi:MAG: multidrug efflux SMR transporter [Desulfobacterota bacterium]|nr:multidrug efflux SMR transporter [Thermodesulfobacteriota bacterium]
MTPKDGGHALGAWGFLFLSGLFEVGWILSLKFTQGFTRPLPILFYALCGAGAAYFLSLALRSLPLSLSYAIWMGMGILGSHLFGVLFLKEPWSFLQGLFMLMILGGLIGLRFS